MSIPQSDVQDLVYAIPITPEMYGAVGDGVTDDSAAIASVMSQIELGQKSILFTQKYKVTTNPGSSLATVSNVDGFNIEFKSGAHILNTDYVTDFITVNLTFSGTTATAVSVTPHGFLNGGQTVIKNGSLAYNGYYKITVIDAYTFTYVLSVVPTGPSTADARRAEISKVLFEFDGCSNGVIIGFNFQGTVQPMYVQSRIGWTGIKLQNSCDNITINAFGSGLAYLIWSGAAETDTGNLKNSNLSVLARDVGYPIALWKSGLNSVFNVNAERVHRAAFAAAATNSTFNIIGKNYDIAQILVTQQRVGTVLFGSQGNTINLTDTGSDLPVQLVESGTYRTQCSFASIDVDELPDADVDMSNNTVNMKSYNSKFTTGLLVKTSSVRHSIINLKVNGFIDRRLLLDSEMNFEFSIGDEVVGSEGTYQGITFNSWQVLNPASGTTKPYVLKCKNLLDDIVINQFLSTSPSVIELPANRFVFFNANKFNVSSDPINVIAMPVSSIAINPLGEIDTSIYFKIKGTNSAGWYPMQPVAFGSTAQRLASLVTRRGFAFYDTSIGRPLWNNGGTAMSEASWTDLLQENVLNSTTNTTITRNSTYFNTDATLGAVTLTLPSAATVRGKRFYFRKADASANLVIIQTVSSEVFNALSSTQTVVKLYNQDDSFVVFSNGSSWVLDYLSFGKNNTTTNQTKTSLNDTYPNALKNYTVYFPNSSAGAAVAVKTDNSGNWLILTTKKTGLTIDIPIGSSSPFNYAYDGSLGTNPTIYIQQLIGTDLYSAGLTTRINGANGSIDVLGDFSASHYQLIIKP